MPTIRPSATDTLTHKLLAKQPNLMDASQNTEIEHVLAEVGVAVRFTRDGVTFENRRTKEDPKQRRTGKGKPFEADPFGAAFDNAWDKPTKERNRRTGKQRSGSIGLDDLANTSDKRKSSIQMRWKNSQTAGKGSGLESLFTQSDHGPSIQSMTPPDSSSFDSTAHTSLTSLSSFFSCSQSSDFGDNGREGEEFPSTAVACNEERNKDSEDILQLEEQEQGGRADDVSGRSGGEELGISRQSVELQVERSSRSDRQARRNRRGSLTFKDESLSIIESVGHSSKSSRIKQSMSSSRLKEAYSKATKEAQSSQLKLIDGVCDEGRIMQRQNERRRRSQRAPRRGSTAASGTTHGSTERSGQTSGSDDRSGQAPGFRRCSTAEPRINVERCRPPQRRSSTGFGCSTEEPRVNVERCHPPQRRSSTGFGPPQRRSSIGFGFRRCSTEEPRVSVGRSQRRSSTGFQPPQRRSSTGFGPERRSRRQQRRSITVSDHGPSKPSRTKSGEFGPIRKPVRTTSSAEAPRRSQLDDRVSRQLPDQGLGIDGDSRRPQRNSLRSSNEVSRRLQRRSSTSGSCRAERNISSQPDEASRPRRPRRTRLTLTEG